MSITHLSTEIIQKIFEYANLEDVVHLAQTSKKNYRTFLGRLMPILERAMHNSYSPLADLLKLVISNEPDKIRKPVGTEVRRNAILNRIIQTPVSPKLTLELVKKMVIYGRIASKWTEIYPQLRWRFGSSNRRLLHPHEKERLRRAIYHHWTYSSLFHDRTYLEYAPDAPHAYRDNPDPRLRLLRTYSTVELVQLSEFLAHMIHLIEHDLFPSNTIVQEHYTQRLPPRALAKIAWGDGGAYARLVRDVMKLNPASLLHLVENTSTKAERAEFIFAQGEWFADAPASLNVALSVVVSERRGGRNGKCATSTLFPSLLAVPFKDEEDENVLFGIVGPVDVDLRHAWDGDACLIGESESRQGVRASADEGDLPLSYYVDALHSDDEEDDGDEED